MEYVLRRAFQRREEEINRCSGRRCFQRLRVTPFARSHHEIRDRLSQKRGLWPTSQNAVVPIRVQLVHVDDRRRGDRNPVDLLLGVLCTEVVPRTDDEKGLRKCGRLRMSDVVAVITKRSRLVVVEVAGGGKNWEVHICIVLRFRLGGKIEG